MFSYRAPSIFVDNVNFIVTNVSARKYFLVPIYAAEFPELAARYNAELLQLANHLRCEYNMDVIVTSLPQLDAGHFADEVHLNALVSSYYENYFSIRLYFTLSY